MKLTKTNTVYSVESEYGENKITGTVSVEESGKVHINLNIADSQAWYSANMYSENKEISYSYPNTLEESFIEACNTLVTEILSQINN